MRAALTLLLARAAAHGGAPDARATDLEAALKAATMKAVRAVQDQEQQELLAERPQELAMEEPAAVERNPANATESEQRAHQQPEQPEQQQQQQQDQQQQRYAEQYAAAYMPDAKFLNMNETNMTDAERERVADYFKTRYAGSYSEFDSNSTMNQSDYMQEYASPYIKQYAGSYLAEYAGGQDNATAAGTDNAQGNAGYSKYMSQYASGQGGGSPSGDYMQYMRTYAGSYLAEYAGGQENRTAAGTDNTYRKTQGDYSRYMSQYAAGNGNYSKFMQNSMAGGQAGGYEKYMAQNGGGQGDFSKFMKQWGDSAASMPGQSGSSSQGSSEGFQKYMSKYLPPGDGDLYVQRWTALWSNSTSNFEEMYSSGEHGYNAYVDRYSAMAGEHPSSPEDWQTKERDQRGAYQEGVGQSIQSGDWQGGLPPSAELAATKNPMRAELPGSSELVAEQRRGALRQRASPPGDAPAASELAAQLPSAPRQDALGSRFFAIVLAGFCLPAAFAFAKTVTRARAAGAEQQEGWKLLVDV